MVGSNVRHASNETLKNSLDQSLLLDTPEQSFPRLGSLRGCERAHVLVLRTWKHFASVQPRFENVRRMKPVDKCYRDASASLIKQSDHLRHIFVCLQAVSNAP